MSDMKATLLWQLMQNMGIGGDFQFAADPPDVAEPHITLDPPWDTLLMLRPMLNLREQRMIDLLVKMQEIKAILEEIQRPPNA